MFGPSAQHSIVPSSHGKKGRRSWRVRKRQSSRLRTFPWYPGVLQTMAATTPKWELTGAQPNFYQHLTKEDMDQCHLQLKDSCSNEDVKPSTDSSKVFAPLYLRATINHGAHLTLHAQVNSISGSTLVDFGATGIFIHPTFAKEYRIQIKTKTVP